MAPAQDLGNCKYLILYDPDTFSPPLMKDSTVSGGNDS